MLNACLSNWPMLLAYVGFLVCMGLDLRADLLQHKIDLEGENYERRIP